MTSNKPFLNQWQSIPVNEQVEMGLVYVEIIYHRQAHLDSLQLEDLKDLLRDCFQTVAEHWGGKLFSWDRHGGAFMFLVEDSQSYDNCCLSAIQMLEMVPSLNQDLRSSNASGCHVEVRIACDCGRVAYQPEPSNIPVDFAEKLAKRVRDVTMENWVTITDRIYGQLTPECQPRFQNWKYSTELETSLYRAAQSHEATSPPNASTRPSLPADAKARGATQDLSATKKRPAAKRSARGGRRRFTWSSASFLAVFVAVVALLVLEFFVVRFTLTGTPRPVNALSAEWTEQVSSPEWVAWRNSVHAILSSPHLTEETLAEALRIKRPEVRSPAAVLRHDQAVGDVLQSYPRVRTLLENRLGIYGEFLGTGYSNPVHALDYERASLHEYLIPNLADSNTRVWMRQIKVGAAVQAPDKTIKDLIEEKSEEDRAKESLKQAIIARAEAGDKEAAMVRFAMFNSEQYKGTLGHPKRERVFACDLAEVWKLKIQEAAFRSGYRFGTGDTLFIWVFMPVQGEAVLATWGQVFEHLPQWMEDAQKRP